MHLLSRPLNHSFHSSSSSSCPAVQRSKNSAEKQEQKLKESGLGLCRMCLTAMALGEESQWNLTEWLVFFCLLYIFISHPSPETCFDSNTRFFKWYFQMIKYAQQWIIAQMRWTTVPPQERTQDLKLDVRAEEMLTTARARTGLMWIGLL